MTNSERKVTYTQIAEAAGVSVATVSRALNQQDLVKPDTLARILGAMQTLGYPTEDPGEGPGAARILFVLLPSIGIDFFSDVVRGIQEGARRRGYTVLVSDAAVDEQNAGLFLQILRQNRAAGIVSVSELSPSVLSRLRAAFPLVRCCDYQEYPNVSCVGIDDLQASRNLMRYLVALGRKRIAVISGDPRRFAYARLRLQGYREVLAEAGLENRPGWEVTLPEVNFSMAVSAASSLLQSGEIPDCIYCTSDVSAAAAIKSCAKAGLRVPQDVMVAGFDNVDISTMTTPTITTVSQPRFEIGYTACSYLLDPIDNPAAPVQHTLLETELIIRESTAASL